MRVLANCEIIDSFLIQNKNHEDQVFFVASAVWHHFVANKPAAAKAFWSEKVEEWMINGNRVHSLGLNIEVHNFNDFIFIDH